MKHDKISWKLRNILKLLIDVQSKLLITQFKKTLLLKLINFYLNVLQLMAKIFTPWS